MTSTHGTPTGEDAPVVRTRSGPVRGRARPGVVEFRGIPFTGPVGGAQRFRAPRPPDPWTDPPPADWPPVAPQPPDPLAVLRPDYYRSVFGDEDTTRQSEGGLHLNLWTPAPDDAHRPVVVFLHGGGFTTGQPTRPRENGARLAAEQDVVVVAPAHRLGVLGFLDTTSALDAVATPGMLDIVRALTWVRENVAAFGGDPGNVTVLGESGGALKAVGLLAMPSARGLFHRLICQSAAYPLAFYTGREDREFSRAAFDAVLRELRLDAAERLRELPVADLIAAGQRTGTVWRPPFGTPELPTTVADAVRAGAARGIPILIGTDRDEMRLLSTTLPLPASVAALCESVGAARAEHYLATSASPAEAGERAITDLYFRIPAIRFAELCARSGSPAHLYRFDWENPARPDVGATHGMETPFVFGTTDAVPSTDGAPGAAELSRTMRAMWAAFARTGSPATPGRPWPAYILETRLTMVLRDEPELVADPDEAERLAWADHAFGD